MFCPWYIEPKIPGRWILTLGETFIYFRTSTRFKYSLNEFFQRFEYRTHPMWYTAIVELNIQGLPR